VSDRVAGQSEKPEHAIFPEPGTRYIENYLPVWSDDPTKIAAVVEVYRSPRALFAAIDKGRQMVWVIAVFGGAFIYLALYAVVYRAHVTLRRQQEKLVNSETFAVIGEMASAVAHGLRNPLASIRSSAELMLDDDIPDTHQESLTDIVAQSDRLEDWVCDFLTSSTGAEADLVAVSVNEVISECANIFAPQFKEKSIDFRVQTHPGVPPIKANAAAIRQVFNNVIANSLEALPTGGELLIETAVTQDNRYIDVVVADTGEGIPENRLTDVFRPYATSKPSGLGIGLPLAKRIIERFGGEMKIASVHGQGTTLSMRIPAAG
jgi:signal transduction histidine kinase